MTPRRCVAAMAPLIGAVWGCGASTEQNAKVIAISPAAAFNDVAFPVSIAGDAFRPIYRFDTMAAATASESGSFSAALTPAGESTTNGSTADSFSLGDVTWRSPDALAAMVPAGIPAGPYDVVVTDPRGTRMQCDCGFVSLGPDTQAPGVRIESPVAGKLIAAGTTVTVALVADDGDGFLGSLGATIATTSDVDELVCTVAPVPHAAPCKYQFTAPVPTDDNALVIITPHATDTAGNPAETTAATFRLVPRPTLVSLSPDSGPASGGTEIVVHGTNFIVPTLEADGSQLLLDGHPIEPTSITPTEIRAVMPHHDPIPGIVSVASGDAETDQKLAFQFISAPVLRLAHPLKGPVTGGTRIVIEGNNFRNPGTTILIGNVALPCQDYQSPIRIEGVVPAGVAPGPVSIVAIDTALDARSTLSDSFVYEATASDSPDGGAEQASCAGAP